MMGDIYYMSGMGNEKICLDHEPYWIQTGDLLDYEWHYADRNNKIRGFKKEINEKTVTLSIFGNTEKDYAQNWNHLHEVFERDIKNMTPGKLYFGSSYLKCFVTSSKKADWEWDCGITDNEIVFLTDSDVWIEEYSKTLSPQTGVGKAAISEGLEYPYDYKYDYAPGKSGIDIWNIDHFASSEFKMIIYGPCADPEIHINDHKYIVYDTLEKNDYIVIDSRDHTVIKHLSNGYKQNLFDKRGKEYSVFERIPDGTVMINWSGTFGFDITLFLERSEPKWN